MAEYEGYLARCKLVSTGGSLAFIGNETKATLSIEGSEINTTTKSSQWHKLGKGRLQWTLSGEGLTDLDDAAQADIIAFGDEVDIEFHPESDATGRNIFTGTGRILRVSFENDQEDQANKITFEIKGSDGNGLTAATIP